MSKILAIADIHIHDYPNRNPENRYRLYQTEKVAENIIEAGKREGADIIVIAGDIIEKSLIRSYIQAEVKLFLDTLMKSFRIGYIIWGNHDQDNKGNNPIFTDSCLSVMLPPNLYYMDGKEIIIDNTKIAFSNWRPEFDLSWISEKVDVLFTHATICYSQQDQVKSQILDESKFDIAICGDIHRPGQAGKYVSIGIPQKCKMSDFDECTGVVLDCVTKQWRWTNLNPQDNLMKFIYTPNRIEEGWNEKTNTWSVFKPETLSISGGIRDVQIPAWEEIGNLITLIIENNNLQDIHGEVLKGIKDLESKEVDFNFQLVRAYCKNWRSIEEAELFFDDMDKILITGANGSGKSSMLSAIRYAFEENRSLKDFIQIGTKECITEVDFIYQGILYRIQRGSKRYGLWINNEPQKFNNKKEFEQDVRRRFPFIDYMKMYFFDSDHHKLIGSITPEEKSDIISKFFKLDRIDVYNEQANILLDLYNKDSYTWKAEINESTRIRNFIDEKLNNIVLPKISREELEQKKIYGLDLQKKSKLWSDYQIYIAQTTAKIQAFEEAVGKKSDSLKRLITPDILDMKISQDEITLNEIDHKILELGNIENEYNLKYGNYDRINSEGYKLYEERSHIDDVKTCPCCGQVIKNQDGLKKHKEELDLRLSELKKELEIAVKDLYSVKERKETSDFKLAKLSEEKKNLSNEISSLKSDRIYYINLENEIQNNINELNQLKHTIDSIPAPEEAHIPDNFMEIMSEIESSINIWDQWNSLILDRTNAEESINRCNEKLDQLNQLTSELQKYIKITGPTGKIYEEIMQKLANQFSDNQVKYEVITYTFRNKDHLDLASSFKNNGNWIAYQACSSGQQTVLDINFLSKIVTRMGLLVMDEFLKHLDPANHEMCIDLISSMNIGCIMLSSHMESIASFNNKSCTLELNESGITKIELK